MAQPPVRKYDPEKFGDIGTSKMFVVSIVFHALLLIALPFALMLLTPPKKIEKLQTFSLTAVPVPPMAPQPAPVTPTPPTPPPPDPTPPPPPPPPVPPPTPTPPPPVPPEPRKQPPREEPRPAPQKPQEQPPPKPVEVPVPEVVPDFSSLPSPVRIEAGGDVKVHPYLAAVRRKLEQNWQPYKEDSRLSVVISFSILRDGNVAEVRIVTSSGDSVLDGNARAAVERASPFGRVPPVFTSDKLEITCTLRPTRK